MVRATISVGLRAEGSVLRLDVSDEGPGFDLDRVGGAGHLDETGHLGLAGVREQAELLGGAVRASSGMPGTGRWSASGGRRPRMPTWARVATPGRA